MAEIDTPNNHPDHLNVSDIASFGSNKEWPDSEELDTDTLNDADFAHYRLAVWAHPSARLHIVESIATDLVDENPRQSPSIQRLRQLMVDPRFDEASTVQDPHTKNFAEAFLLATSDEQVFALKTVQRLHAVTLSSETTYSGINHHLRQIVIAILGTSG